MMSVYKPLVNFVSLYKLILGRLRSKLSQLILVTPGRSFQMEFISIFYKVLDKREFRPILISWALSNEASGTIFIMYDTVCD